MNLIIFSSHHFHICDFPPSSQEGDTLFSAIKKRWLLGPEWDVPSLFLEPHLPSPLHLREARQLAAPSASPLQSHLAGWGTPEQKNEETESTLGKNNPSVFKSWEEEPDSWL